MSITPAIWATPQTYLHHEQPDHPMFFFIPENLKKSADLFLQNYPGLVSYAVKANDAPEVIENLVAVGVGAFDVASVAEMARVRGVFKGAVLHYNNPVRSPAEIRAAMDFGVVSYSVDSVSELEKIAAIVPANGVEITARLALPVAGAKYDFGDKFGAGPERVVELLKRISALGFTPSITFHPGTQCADPQAWVSYISVCADVAVRAGVRLARLNTGGGYAAHRGQTAPDLVPIFTAIETAVQSAFGKAAPKLVCEPGRALVADAFVLATRVKAVRDDGSVFLNDGIYGGFGESPSMGTVDRVRVMGDNGAIKTDGLQPRKAFGPTCDSLDTLPAPVMLPDDLSEGDYVLFSGMGAYAHATVTRFNGYGVTDMVTVQQG